MYQKAPTSSMRIQTTGYSSLATCDDSKWPVIPWFCKRIYPCWDSNHSDPRRPMANQFKYPLRNDFLAANTIILGAGLSSHAGCGTKALWRGIVVLVTLPLIVQAGRNISHSCRSKATKFNRSWWRRTLSLSTNLMVCIRIPVAKGLPRRTWKKKTHH